MYSEHIQRFSLYLWKHTKKLCYMNLYEATKCWYYVSVQFSRSVVSDSLRPHGLQHARLACPSQSPRACANSCPSSRWCHPTISSSTIPFSFCLQSFLALVFSNESVLHIKWPKYWSFSFSISPSNEYSGLISFRMDWLDLLAVEGTQESFPTPQFKSINSSTFSLLYSPTLTSIYDSWKSHSFVCKIMSF